MLANMFEGPDLIIILAIVMLLFGPKNLPKLAQSIGKSVRELKNGLNGITEEEQQGNPATVQPDPQVATLAKAQQPMDATVDVIPTESTKKEA